jgi:hypothetical protein
VLVDHENKHDTVIYELFISRVDRTLVRQSQTTIEKGTRYLPPSRTVEVSDYSRYGERVIARLPKACHRSR